jgi:Ca-activated chloride channel family protein
MIHFEWPWLFILLPLPWIYRRFLSPAPANEGAALRVPEIEDFVQTETRAHLGLSRRWPLWIATGAWILCVIASARPQWLGEIIQMPLSGRDLMLAVDLSGSMDEKDFLIGDKAVDRLTATKNVAGEFIQKRQGDRIGLILFGEQAYLQTPLTFDLQTVDTLLNEAVIGLAGKSTAIGDAIGLAVKRLRSRDETQRILILLTDGANTAGAVNPLDAADLAAREGLKIYTIGIGADKMMVRDFFGTRYVNPSAELDEISLKAIAEKTGGRYFRARNTQELHEIYTLLDNLEPIEQETHHFRPKTALFPWPLAVALMLCAVLAVGRILNKT